MHRILVLQLAKPDEVPVEEVTRMPEMPDAQYRRCGLSIYAAAGFTSPVRKDLDGITHFLRHPTKVHIRGPP